MFAGNHGVIKDAHLYDYGYGTVSVKTREGKTITFTVDVKENEDFVE